MSEKSFGENPKKIELSQKKQQIEALDAFEPTGDLVKDFAKLTEIRGAEMAKFQYDPITSERFFDETDEKSMYGHFKSLKHIEPTDPVQAANAQAFDRMIEAYEQNQGLKQ